MSNACRSFEHSRDSGSSEIAQPLAIEREPSRQSKPNPIQDEALRIISDFTSESLKDQPIHTVPDRAETFPDTGLKLARFLPRFVGNDLSARCG